jgi:sugar/nucleoside kinase (ribokinase family)
MRSGIVCSGVSCVDLFLYGTEPLATRESLSMVHDTQYRPGGATSNTGRALVRLGMPASYLTVIGDDPNGTLLLGLWAQDGVDTRHVVRTGEAGTALSTVPVYADGKRGVYFCPGTNDVMDIDNLFGPNREHLAMLRERLAFHLGYPPLLKRLQGEALAALLTLVRETGVLVSLDTTPIANDTALAAMLAPALHVTHLFKPNIEEAAQVTGRFTALAARARAAGTDIENVVTADEVRAIGEALLAMGVPIVLISLGPNGAYLCTADADTLRAVPHVPADLSGWADQRVFVPAYRVDGPLNSAGAGDTFLAAVLTGLCSGGASLAEIVRLAHGAAALHVELAQRPCRYAELPARCSVMTVAEPSNVALRALIG